MFPSSDDQDAAIHALYARFPDDPVRVLGIFARPLFATVYVIPGLIGYPAMRVFTLLVCLAMAWLTYRAAERAGLAFAWLAIPFVLTQPALYQLGTETMTEPIFALTLAGGLYALAGGREIVAALVLSLLPLARPEGPVVLVTTAACWASRALASRKTRLAIVLLAAGTALWQVAWTLTTGDVRYIGHTLPWAFDTSAIHGDPLHYLIHWPAIIGLGVLPLWLIGAVVGRRMPLLRLAVAITLAVLTVHTYLWAAGRLASWGFDRYFATLAPCTALLATAGLGALTKRRAAVAAGLAAPLLILQAAQAFLYVDMNSNNYVAAATKEAVDHARARIDLRGRPVLSADHFGYVFADVGAGSAQLPVGDSSTVSRYLSQQPAGTVVLWDDLTGETWYHLTADAIVGLGYRMLWDRKGEQVGSPRVPTYERWRLYTHPRLYRSLGWGPSWRIVRESALVRQ